MKKISYFLLFILLVSCSPKGTEPIKLNSDGCDFCKMKIADGKFGAELITLKGRVYKFDDIHCMMGFKKENTDKDIKSFYIHDFNQNNVLIPAKTSYYLTGGQIHSPMRGNTIAVQTEKEAMEIAEKFNANSISWAEIIK